MKEIDLESQLKIKKNEYKMLNDSFIDLIDKNGNQTSINELKKAIESTMDDIYEISEQIRCEEINKRAFATKDAIDNMEKQGFYDSIKKQENFEDDNKANLTDKECYGELYEHLCSAQYLARKIGDKLLEDEIKDIRANVGDTLLRFHGYLK